ncbi:ATP-binding protein [Streptomyces acidiscabies]|uniref:ATP-binding protein n=1 Tax=Streptomyces acidiscabies TaxID=42234 RepID=A0AAP6EE63_9ACTN|nr:ATP-binding protein [Streptomyces acidiscabies]MBP5939383.1 ATP-binding protein [Streptomyces sp. LBUM 1476]MBZ3910523.1 ATP-binding protein [Streptomyces acidiscabies]MDX2959523.1 ATP-binding protein [Streptomyces acidiscabies]MDX3019189.1 ATP-binding protein [Streptomyces acidiscabies]MDX3790730.1 ATP-binding protein [Streptomyces acidiscabies]
MPGYDIIEPRLRCVLPFEAAPAEVSLLRRAVAKQLSQWGMPAAVDEAELLVTELVTNVVKHVGEGVAATLVLESGGERLRVEIHDRSNAVPVLRGAGCDEECGRGLHLLGALAADWGTALTAVGKAVWCEIAVERGSECRRIARAVAAVKGYQESCGGRLSSTQEASAIELIVDLLHWTSALGHDPDDFLDRAQVRYEVDAA